MQPSNPEPVVTAEGIRVVLAGAVAAGWIALDDQRLMAVATAVAVGLSIASSVWARARVRPLSGASGSASERP